jgi:hypothetical protein
MSTASELRDERVKLLYKKMIRSVSTNSSVSGAELGVLAGSNAINGRSSVQQEDIYASSIPSSYTTSTTLLGALTVKYEYSSATVVNKYTGTYPSTWVAASPASFNPATAKLNINTYGLTTDLWQAFVDGDLSRVYTFVDSSTSSVVVYVEKLILDEVSATLEGGSPSYGHPALADAIQFSTCGGAYVGKIESQYATDNNSFTVDTIGNWVLQSDCGTLQFLDQGATYRLGSLNSNNPCNLFAISGATTDVWFTSAKPPVISFWKYIGKKGSAVLCYGNRYSYIEGVYNGSKSSIYFHYNTSINTYDARIYATGATSTSSKSSLVMDAGTKYMTILPSLTVIDVKLNLPSTYGTLNISGGATNGYDSIGINSALNFLGSSTYFGLYDNAIGHWILLANASSNIVVYYSASFADSFKVETTGATVAGSFIIGGIMYSVGFACRTGASGSYSGNWWNMWWIGSSANFMYVYIDVSLVATITYTGSDYRLKQVICNQTGGLEKLMLLRPVTFYYQNFGMYVEDGIQRHGFIAHEVQEVISDGGTGVKDEVDEKGTPLLQSLNLTAITSVLVQAYQELAAKVEILRAKVEAAESKLNAI